ncbi:hypothetical protein FB107DRAFT_202934 [Schizophyllum commune]
MSLVDLDDDVVLKIFSFLQIPEILALRQVMSLARKATCRRFYLASCLRIVWTDFCISEILTPGYPFPDVSLESLSPRDLEHLVRRAHGLARRWRTNTLNPRTIGSVQMGTGTAPSAVRFLPGHDGRWLLTISKGIWSIATLWRVDARTGLRKACEWSPRRALIDGFAVNKRPGCAYAAVALSLRFQQDDRQVVQLLRLREEGEDARLEEVLADPLETNFKPTLLDGDILALSDDLTSTIILNWKLGVYATLEQPHEEDSLLTHDNGVLVELARHSILVVRARSIHLFPAPELRPRDRDPLTYRPYASHSFGWVDGVAVQTFRRRRVTAHPLSILIRSECDDPWTTDAHGLDLYTISPNPAAAESDEEGGDDSVTYPAAPYPGSASAQLASPTPSAPAQNPATQSATQSPDTEISPASSPPTSPHSSQSPISLTPHPAPHSPPRIPAARNYPARPPPPAPFLFPPVHAERFHSSRGALRCTDLVLGPCGTAVWVQPPDYASAGLMFGNDDGRSMQNNVPSLNSHEAMMAGAFEGPLRGEEEDGDGDGLKGANGLQGVEGAPLTRHGRVLLQNPSNDWTSLDYDELLGRIAFGSSGGYVKVVQL